LVKPKPLFMKSHPPFSEKHCAYRRGHAYVGVMCAFGLKSAPGVRLTVIARQIQTPDRRFMAKSKLFAADEARFEDLPRYSRPPGAPHVTDHNPVKRPAIL